MMAETWGKKGKEKERNCKTDFLNRESGKSKTVVCLNRKVIKWEKIRQIKEEQEKEEQENDDDDDKEEVE